MRTLQVSRQQIHSARFGAIGFGIGFAVVGIGIGALGRQIRDFDTGLYFATLLFALAGGFGGAMLGFACKSPSKTQGNLPILVLAGALGCGLGYFVTATFFSAYVEERIRGSFALAIAHALQLAAMGAFIGASLGGVQRNGKQVGKSALAGAIGFALYSLVLEILFALNLTSELVSGPVGALTHERIASAITLGTWGGIGGVIVGACLGIAYAQQH